jgi:tungstate transport system substrate-binding protein
MLSALLCLAFASIAALIAAVCVSQPDKPASVSGCAKKEVVKLSSTIGPIAAGIVPLLAKTYEERTGTAIEFEGAGTWVTLEKAKGGGFDMVIVHARSLEDRFIADGYGIDRRDIMYNDFMILGSDNDPAGIRGMTDAAAAFAKIAASKALFVTRGDLSGTHVKELEIWEKAGVCLNPAVDDWYVTFEDGKLGNAPITLYANERGAYLLMDRATHLILKNRISIVPLVERDSILLNFIAAIAVNPEKFPGINAKDAKAFTDWVCGDEAQAIIRDFEVEKYHEPLFFPNSDEWNMKHKRWCIPPTTE